MNDEEIRSTLEQIKAQVKAKPENKDKSDDEIDELILESFYKAYTDGKMTKEDLGGLAQAMGYEFTEEFDQDPEAANEVNPGEGAAEEGAPGATQEDLEAVRTMEPGESAEEFKEKVEDVKEGEHVAEEEPKEEEVKEEGEDVQEPAAETKVKKKAKTMNAKKHLNFGK